MPSEKVLTPPLSATEIEEAILDSVRLAIRRDCNLAPGNAYGTFSAHITGRVLLYDMGTEFAVNLDAKAKFGEQTEGGKESEIEITMNEKPPNAVRVESGLPVPVQVRNASGKNETKYVKYGRDRAAKSQTQEQSH